VTTPAPYLQFEDVTKMYPGVTALKGVSFGVCPGSIHALMGENGAGKSTLLKALSGAHAPTSGQFRIGGAAHVFNSTADAMTAGVTSSVATPTAGRTSTRSSTASAHSRRPLAEASG